MAADAVEPVGRIGLPLDAVIGLPLGIIFRFRAVVELEVRRDDVAADGFLTVDGVADF